MSGHVWQTMAMSFTSTDISVFSAVSRSWRTVPQIASACGVPDRTVRYSLKKLVRAELVTRQQASPAPYYSRNPSPDADAWTELVQLASATGVAL